MISWTRRLRALFLSLLFLSGGTSLPGLDVLLFHSTSQPRENTPHFESDAGCTTHAGHCSVGVPTSATGALGSRTILPILSVDIATARLVVTIFQPVLHARGIGFLSRAPPTLHV